MKNLVSNLASKDRFINNKLIGNKLIKLGLLSSLLLLSACASYKSTWDCPRAKGISCGSISFADEVAKEQILLNTAREKSTVLINNQDQDLIDENNLEVEEIEVE